MASPTYITLLWLIGGAHFFINANPFTAAHLTTLTTTTANTLTTATSITASAENCEANYQLDDYDSITKIDLYSELLADENYIVQEVNCPVDELITSKAAYKLNSTIEKTLKYIKQHVKVKWCKNDYPFWRMNGNRVDKLSNFSLALYNVGATDAGWYTCLLNYSAVEPEFLSYVDASRGAKFQLLVHKTSHGLPDIQPAITHPPGDRYVHRGENITFTCKRMPTLSHQTTQWFKSCPFRSKSSCIAKFLKAVDKAIKKASPSPLESYFIEGSQDDDLRVNNVTEDNAAYYGCVVSNILGIDVRVAKVELRDDSAQAQFLLGLTDHARLSVHGSVWLLASFGVTCFLLITIVIGACIGYFRLSLRREKGSPLLAQLKTNKQASNKDANLRQHLPTIGCTDIYNIGKTADGFISGHLHQDTGHLMSQSICSNILDKGNPSISSSNSQQSDEACSSWSKSMSSNGDNSRLFYQHTSNNTATTVPMYDHPPSTGTFKLRKGLVRDACTINYSYGFLRPDNATHWSFPRRNLDRMDKIGEGQFGEVWRYIARQKDGNGEIVAVKQLKSSRAGLGDRERFELLAEIEIMKLVNNHPNVIKLLHCCIDENEPILLIMEYAENGKLQTYLRNCRVSKKSMHSKNDYSYPSITSKELLKFTYHIAKGMEYVAAQGIVHRDLASRNILVTREKICKVADFGFARRVGEDCAYERTTANPVPVKWMAPEALVENRFTTKSDVFSLGILMWEIVTLGATPYEQLSSEGVYKKVSTGGRLERPAHCKDEFYNLMAQCWHHQPIERPNFAEVASQLEKLLLSENNYIELDQYPEHAYYNILNVDEREVVNLKQETLN